MGYGHDSWPRQERYQPTPSQLMADYRGFIGDPPRDGAAKRLRRMTRRGVLGSRGGRICPCRMGWCRMCPDLNTLIKYTQPGPSFCTHGPSSPSQPVRHNAYGATTVTSRTGRRIIPHYMANAQKSTLKRWIRASNDGQDEPMVREMMITPICRYRTLF
jgi:hypothetical protein